MRLSAKALLFLVSATAGAGVFALGDSRPPSRPLNVPIPVLHGAKGIKLPYFDDKGRMQMDLDIESAYRTDSDHMTMKNVRIQTFDPDGKPDLMIEMPDSVLDLGTKVLRGDQKVRIQSVNLDISGKSLELNTETRSGKVTGPVRVFLFTPRPATESSRH